MLQDFDVDKRVVEGFDCDGHVIVVVEKRFVGRRKISRFCDLAAIGRVVVKETDELKWVKHGEQNVGDPAGMITIWL